MDKQQAQEIIKNTFENPFDKVSFTNFIKNLLNNIDESKAFHAHGYVKEGFRGIIKTYERIGTYTSADDKKIDIIIIYLQKGFSLDHARVTQRNFAGRYLADRGNKNAGLFAFVSPEESDWRFSLVTIDYEIVQSKAGNWKGQEKFSQARRWSFLVGANEKSHTAQSRLVDILKETDPKYKPTLAELEKAFDIETVTKEFFLKYRELFLLTKEELDRVVKKDPKVKADFEAKGVDTVNFAKKLLGQIIFLYFLQKKGWFGVGRDDDWGTGSKHFLRELFKKKHAGYNNFYNDILEPLFYEALRIDRSHDDGYYSRFNCKIPFLNGGLFDPIGNYDWVKTDIIIPDKLFSNNVKTKEGDKGTGILDVFDRYNFTVKEDEPLEKEVAIDPELLGKSYEKFNAIRPDNYTEFKKALKSGKKGDENKFNKKFGVYYTPREIVHYMCRQSLINYLNSTINTRKKSIGSKPVAVQKKLFDPQAPVQLTLTSGSYKPIIPKKDIETLLHIGEHVSENEERVMSKGKETKTYSHQLPESIRKNAKQIDDKLAEITVCDPAVGSGAFPVGMMSEIVKTRNVLTVFLNNKKRKTYNFKRRCIEHSLYGVDIDSGAVEIAKLRLWLSLVVDEDDIKNIKPLPNLDYKIVCGNSLLGVEKNLFNFNLFNELEKLKPLFFNETNPTKKHEYKKQIDKLISEITRGHTEFDFEVYFSEVFHNKGGFDVVIANPPYGRYTGITTSFKNKLKKHCIYGPTSDLAEFFIRNTLNNLLSEYGFLTFIVPKGLSYVTSWREMRKKLLTEHNLYTLIDAGKSFDAVLYEMLIFILQKGNKLIPKKNITTGYLSQDTIIEMQTPRNFLTEGTFYFGFPKSYYNILKKVKLSCKPISMYADFWYGKGGMTPHVNREKRGIPVLTGKEIQRYHTVPRKDGRWYLEKHFLNNNDLHRAKRETVVVQDIVAHITRPYPHIKLTAALDYDSRLCLNTVMCFSTTSKISNSFLVGLLNSKFISFYYYYFVFNQAIRTMHFMPGYADVMPIPWINIEQHDKLDFLVQKVMKEKNVNSNTDVLILEREIDQLVYKLYDLTPEEIKIVEGEIK